MSNYLKSIIANQDSAFGLFARKLEARTDNGELMNLVDDSGCPVNELIFPALQLEDGTRSVSFSSLFGCLL